MTLHRMLHRSSGVSDYLVPQAAVALHCLALTAWNHFRQDAERRAWRAREQTLQSELARVQSALLSMADTPRSRLGQDSLRPATLLPEDGVTGSLPSWAADVVSVVQSTAEENRSLKADISRLANVVDLAQLELARQQTEHRSQLAEAQAACSKLKAKHQVSWFCFIWHRAIMLTH